MSTLSTIISMIYTKTFLIFAWIMFVYLFLNSFSLPLVSDATFIAGLCKAGRLCSYSFSPVVDFDRVPSVST